MLDWLLKITVMQTYKTEIQSAHAQTVR